MAEYVALEKSIYETIRSKPFTSIPTKPTWAQKELLVEEAEQIGLEMNVSYTWAKDYEFLAETQLCPRKNIPCARDILSSV